MSVVQQSVAKEKSYNFAIRIIKLHKFLTEEKREFVLSREVLKSGTAIGASVKEALQGESRTDFLHHIYAALKEASRTEYWLELLKTTEYIDQKAYDSINTDCTELIKILTATIKTAKRNQEN